MIKIISVLALLAVLSAPRAQAAPARIGAAGAVSGLVKAMAAQETVGRIMQSGKPLYLNDHVTTDAKGRLQVMLLDETIFTLGPNSDMVLDEFVYDPVTDAGKVSAKITKGVFRFVTGKVARKDPSGMKVKLAVGTIGIRGTIAAGRTSDQGSTVILLGPGTQNNSNEQAGAITIDYGNSSVLIDQPGFGATIAPGQQTLSVADLSAQAAQLTSDLSSDPSPAGRGGANGAGQGGQSGGQESGQAAAAAGASLLASADTSLMTQTLDNAANRALQDIAETAANITNGIASWNDLRSIQSGLATYFGSGITNNAKPISLALAVDFGARTYGSASSFLSIQDQTYNPTTNISNTSFASLSGTAAIRLTYGVNSSNSEFNNTTLTFENVGGIAAKAVKADVVYSGIAGPMTGDVVALRTP